MGAEPNRRRLEYVAWGCVLGYLPGAVAGIVLCGPMLVERVIRTAHGETGASADWSEPLVYMIAAAVAYGVPGAGIGGLIGAAVAWAERRRIRQDG